MNRHRRKFYVLAATAAVALAILLFALSGDVHRPKPLYSADSRYQRILVYEDGPIRALRFGASRDALNQSKIDTRDLGRHLLEYTRLAFAGLLVNENPRRVLVIGLGGGVIPRQMRRCFPDAQIDVVEIDPEVVRVAREFFFFRTDKRMRVHVSDGRVFVRRQMRRDPPASYDMIILDAFNNEYIPFHLTTREFLQQVSAVLHPKGVVVANVFRGNQLFDAELETFRHVFGRCHVFVAWRAGNAILVAPGGQVAALEPRAAAARAGRLQERHGFTFSMPAVAAQFRPRLRPEQGAPILTDDKAPANLLRHQVR